MKKVYYLLLLHFYQLLQLHKVHHLSLMESIMLLIGRNKQVF